MKLGFKYFGKHYGKWSICQKALKCSMGKRLNVRSDFHILCMALTRLRVCEGPSEPSTFAGVLSTKTLLPAKMYLKMLVLPFRTCVKPFLYVIVQ